MDSRVEVHICDQDVILIEKRQHYIHSQWDVTFVECVKFNLSAYIKNSNYRKTSSISRTLVGNKIVDHSDVVGATPVGAAPTTSSFLT